MNKIYTYYTVFILMIVLLVSSCVSDDGSFPEDPGNEITSTPAIVTILNDLNVKGDTFSEDQLCFRFQYPLTLGYNTDSNIRIDSYQGLLDVISGQSSNFNITGIQFPVEIIYSGNTTTNVIGNEAALFEVIRECQLTTFRDIFNKLFKQCFKFDYPVILKNGNKEETTIDGDEGFIRFLSAQGENYQPDFTFPVNILVAPNFEANRISTYYEFYQILNLCVGCPDIRFDVIPLQDNIYQFTPNFEIGNGYELSFKVNEEVIPDVIIDGSVFTRQFSPGTYEVCIKAITPDCLEGKSVCKEIIVEPICPDLLFDFVQQPGSLSYNFTADFVGIDDISYDWVIDNEVIESDGGANGDNMFTFDFTPGTHKACIKTETPSCPNGIELCRDIIVCPELSFTSMQQGVTSTYDFVANFPGKEDISYQWLINDNIQEEDGGAVNGDNEFTFNFTPGDYEVCIVTEIEGCTDGVRFCMSINIP